MEVLIVNTVRAIRTLWADSHFRSLARLTVIAITSGVVFYSLVEHLSPVDALYFSVTTLTTVGYGDFSPQTTAGKLFTVVYVLIGVGLLRERWDQEVAIAAADQGLARLCHHPAQGCIDRDVAVLAILDEDGVGNGVEHVLEQLGRAPAGGAALG